MTKFGISYKTRRYSKSGTPSEGYERKVYYGTLKSLKDKWDSKGEAKRSRAFRRLRTEHRNPRVIKRR